MAGNASMKMETVKKAYAEIILDTSKEAAARIMVAERRAVCLQRELVGVKEDALRLLVQLKWMLDSKMVEAEVTSVNQQRKVDELEAQLSEAEGIIVDLREELRMTQDRLEEVSCRQWQPLKLQTSEDFEDQPSPPLDNEVIAQTDDGRYHTVQYPLTEIACGSSDPAEMTQQYACEDQLLMSAGEKVSMTLQPSLVSCEVQYLPTEDVWSTKNPTEMTKQYACEDQLLMFAGEKASMTLQPSLVSCEVQYPPTEDICSTKNPTEMTKQYEFENQLQNFAGEKPSMTLQPSLVSCEVQYPPTEDVCSTKNPTEMTQQYACEDQLLNSVGEKPLMTLQPSLVSCEVQYPPTEDECCIKNPTEMKQQYACQDQLLNYAGEKPSMTLQPSLVSCEVQYPPTEDVCSKKNPTEMTQQYACEDQLLLSAGEKPSMTLQTSLVSCEVQYQPIEDVCSSKNSTEMTLQCSTGNQLPRSDGEKPSTLFQSPKPCSSNASVNVIDGVKTSKEHCSSCSSEPDEHDGKLASNGSQAKSLEFESNCGQTFRDGFRRKRNNLKYQEAIAALRRSSHSKAGKSCQAPPISKCKPRAVKQFKGLVEVAVKLNYNHDTARESSAKFANKARCGELEGAADKQSGRICNPCRLDKSLENCDSGDVQISEDEESACISNQDDSDKGLKFTFQRKRKRESLAKPDNKIIPKGKNAVCGNLLGKEDAAKIQKFVVKDEQSKDGQLLKIAHQLILMSKNGHS